MTMAGGVRGVGTLDHIYIYLFIFISTQIHLITWQLILYSQAQVIAATRVATMQEMASGRAQGSKVREEQNLALQL